MSEYFYMHAYPHAAAHPQSVFETLSAQATVTAAADTDLIAVVVVADMAAAAAVPMACISIADGMSCM